MKDSGIGPGTKIHLVVLKKDGETNKQPIANTTSVKPIQQSKFLVDLKRLAEPFVIDTDLFISTFSKEMKNLAYEMSLDDIERYAESREALVSPSNAETPSPSK